MTTPDEKKFRNDASFYERRGKFFEACVSFESCNNPGYFIRHSNSLYQINKFDGTQLFKEDASFNNQCYIYGSSVVRKSGINKYEETTMEALNEGDEVLVLGSSGT